MLFIHFLRQERIDIRDGDRLKSALSVKQLNKEWPHRTAAAFNCSRRQTSIFFHEGSEFGQHLVIDSCRFGRAWRRLRKVSHSAACAMKYSRDRLACELFGEGRLCLDHRLAAFLISRRVIVWLGRSANLRYSAIDSKSRAFMRMVHSDIPCAAQ
jgi:hypothetical protein